MVYNPVTDNEINQSTDEDVEPDTPNNLGVILVEKLDNLKRMSGLISTFATE